MLWKHFFFKLKKTKFLFGKNEKNIIKNTESETNNMKDDMVLHVASSMMIMFVQIYSVYCKEIWSLTIKDVYMFYMFKRSLQLFLKGWIGKTE